MLSWFEIFNHEEFDTAMLYGTYAYFLSLMIIDFLKKKYEFVLHHIFFLMVTQIYPNKYFSLFVASEITNVFYCLRYWTKNMKCAILFDLLYAFTLGPYRVVLTFWAIKFVREYSAEPIKLACVYTGIAGLFVLNVYWWGKLWKVLKKKFIRNK